MSIEIILQRENGEAVDQVLDFHSDLGRIWPIGGEAFPLLQYIDPYGNTIFNGPQMGEVIRELDSLAVSATTEAARSLLTEVRGLAVRCRNNEHLYLKFVGD
jgi:hypothetical protein